MEDSKICYKGWNWGEASIESTSLAFRIGGESAFDVPLNDITQATAQKSEAVVEMAGDAGQQLPACPGPAPPRSQPRAHAVADACRRRHGAAGGRDACRAPNRRGCARRVLGSRYMP